MPKFLNAFTIKVSGQNISEEIYDDLEEVVVDTSLNMPAMFSFRIHDRRLKWVDDVTFDIGKEVEIGAVLDEEAGGSSNSLIKGEITALEPTFSASGDTFLVVRGYDKSHRLHHGVKTRTFLKVKDSDLVSRIAGEAGLSTQADTTTVTYDYILQYNQTNMEFLRSRADRIGFRVYVADGKLYFTKGESLPTTSSATLTYLDDLLTFEPRRTAVHQANTMKVMGWDAKQKQAITSQDTPKSGLNQGGMTKTGGAQAQSSFGAAEAILVDHPVDSVDQAKSLASGLSSDISLEYIQAEGTCTGNPKVQAGKLITIQNVGTRFSGKYMVTSALHHYSPDGYETRFSISGRNPNTLMALLTPNDGNQQGRGQVNGLVTALVTNLQDPDDLGRVKVKFPWLGENIESDWVRIAVPMAGAQRGLMILPEVNDEVLIAFEHGDVHHPYIVGSLWSSTDKPPEQLATVVQNGKVNQRIFKTRKGHIVTFDDKDGEEKITIKSKSGHQIVLDDKSGSENVSIKDKTGSNSMVIDSSKNSMTIKVGGDFTVEATGKIHLKSTGAMNLEATGDAKLKGMNASLEGTTKGEVKGAQVSMNGSAQAEVKGGGMVTVQGALVKIN